MSPAVLWTSIIAFSLLMIVVGLLGMRATRATLEDYVLGGRSLGFIAAFFTSTVTLFSAFSYFGIMGWFYAHGIGTWVLVSNTAVLGLVLYFAGSRLWLLGHKYGFLNVTDYLSDRYRSPAVGIVAGLLMIISLVPYIGVQFRGSGLTLEAFSDGAIPFWAGALFLAVVVTLYVAAGGFRGVVWTDMIQGILMYGVLISAMFIIVYGVAGSFGGLMDEISRTEPAVLSHPGPVGLFSLPFLISLILVFGLANFTMPQMQQRWLALRDHRTLKLLAIFFALGTGIIYLCGFYIAMAGRVAFPDLENPEAVYPALVATWLPPWLAALALIAMLAATATTANSLILTISSIVTNDYYRPLLGERYGMSQRTVTNIARLLIPVVMAGALLVTFFGPPTIIGILVDITWPAVFMIFPTVIAGLYWKRATPAGALASILVGEALLITLSRQWIEITLHGWHPAIPAVILGTIVLIAVSVLTRPLPARHLERHFGEFEAEALVMEEQAATQQGTTSGRS